MPGKDIVKNNQYAVLLMSGGQGTRLGYNGPKAFFPLEFLNNTTILELQASKVLEASKSLNATITMYLMTNTDSHNSIEEFVKEKNYFGLGKENVKLFMQENVPLIDEKGKILMSSKSDVIEVPNGNGGIYSSLKNTGMIEDIKNRGVKYTAICNIDNILAQLVDMSYIGYVYNTGALASCKTVVKTNPHEKVGAFCLKNEKPGVIEYSDISKEMAEATDENGDLLYGDSYFGYSIVTTKGLELFAETKMPYHKAVKKYNYINIDGEIVEPESPNAYKFEKFIFDSYAAVNEMPLLRVKREEEFAPVKNTSRSR